MTRKDWDTREGKKGKEKETTRLSQWMDGVCVIKDEMMDGERWMKMKTE